MLIICKIINSVGCPRHLTIASKLLRIKTCLSGVFWVFHGIFLALFDIYRREPDFWAENQIFKNFSKSLKTCLVGVFWVFQSIFSIVRHLGREPDFWAENRIFKKILKKPQNMFSWCFLSFNRKYKDYVYRKMLVQEYLKKWRIFKRVKPKNDMMYHDIYNCICQNTKK